MATKVMKERRAFMNKRPKAEEGQAFMYKKPKKKDLKGNPVKAPATGKTTAKPR